MADIVARLSGYADPQYKKELLGKGSLDGVINDLLDDAVEAGRKIESLRAKLREADALVEKAAWRSMDTAPKDGTEINGYRPDQGVFTFRWAVMSEFVDDDAVVDGHDSEFAWWWHDRWGWMEKELTPTLWKPLPEEPSSALPSTVLKENQP